MFTRIVKRKNRSYLYEERRWREGGKVRSQSRCLGPVGGKSGPSGENEAGWLRRQFPGKQGLDWDKIERQQLDIANREKAKSEDFAAKMHAAYGMRMDTPIGPVEKVSASARAISVDEPATNPAAPASPDHPQSPDVAAPAAPEAQAAPDAAADKS